MNQRIAKNDKGHSKQSRGPLRRRVERANVSLTSGIGVFGSLRRRPRRSESFASRGALACTSKLARALEAPADTEQHGCSVQIKHSAQQTWPIGLFSPDRSADAKCLLTHHTRLQYMHCNTPTGRSVGDFRRFHGST